MNTLNMRPSWLTSLLPLLAVWQYGDRSIARGELFRMALSADAAANAAVALERIANMRDRDGNAIAMHRDELRAIASRALAEIEQVQPRAPLAMAVEPTENGG